MSNKKQSSIEWLLPKILGLTLELSNNRISQRTCELKILELFEQAKAMHEEEVETAYWEGGQDVPMTSKRCEQYYNEMYGGNNG